MKIKHMKIVYTMVLLIDIKWAPISHKSKHLKHKIKFFYGENFPIYGNRLFSNAHAHTNTT